MAVIVFDGEKEAERRARLLARRVSKLKEKGMVAKLVSVVVGDNPTSHLYVDLKGEMARLVGIGFEKLVFPKNAKPSSILSGIEVKCEEKEVTGLMVQLPLPEVLKQKELEILNRIDPKKDVDCLTSENLGRLVAGKPRFLPATVKAVMSILARVQRDLLGQTGRLNKKDLSRFLRGKRVVVVGRSKIVGKPLAAHLTNLDAVVTVAHSKTADLAGVTRQAEILISATGSPGLIKSDMVKKGAVVIDVGEPKPDVEVAAGSHQPGQISVYEKVGFITPVPGGVGPMTVVSLLENVVQVEQYGR